MPRHIANITRDVIDNLHDRMENPEKWRPAPTGLEDLDHILRILPKKIYTIEGIEKSAKTTLAQRLAMALAGREGGKILYCQMEEGSYEMGIRVLTSLTPNTDRNDIMDLHLSEDDFAELEAAQVKTQDMTLFVEDRTFKFEDIKKLITEHDVTACVIDYFQLLEDTFPGIHGENNRLAAISKSMIRFVQSWVSSQGIPPTLFLVAQDNDDKKQTVNNTRQLNRDVDQRIRIIKTLDAISGGTIDGSIDIDVMPGRIGHGGKCTVAFNGAHSRLGNIIAHLNLSEPDKKEMVQPEMQEDDPFISLFDMPSEEIPDD